MVISKRDAQEKADKLFKGNRSITEEFIDNLLVIGLNIAANKGQPITVDMGYVLDAAQLTDIRNTYSLAGWTVSIIDGLNTILAFS